MELKNDIEERRGPLRNMRRKTSFRFPILVKVGLKEATETKFRANRKMGTGDLGSKKIKNKKNL